MIETSIKSTWQKRAILGWLTLWTIALLFSILYHLPASWLLSQKMVQQNLPKTLQLTQITGSIWDGSGQVALLNADQKASPAAWGEVAWQLSPWSILWGQLETDIRWHYLKNEVSGQIYYDFLKNTEQVVLENMLGTLDLPQLLERLQGFGLQGLTAEGVIDLQYLTMHYDLAQQWPSRLAGKVNVNQLDIFGAVIPSVEVTPTVEKSQIILNVAGKAPGWALSGRVDLNQARNYTIALKVNADSEKQMPDWANLFAKQGTKVAVLNTYGKW